MTLRFSYPMFAVGAAATLWLLIQAKDVLQPLLVAIVFWFLIRALAGVYAKVLRPSAPTPGAVATALSAATAALLLVLGAGAIATNFAELQSNVPIYEANLAAKTAQINQAFGTEFSLDLRASLDTIDASAIAFDVAGTAVGLVTTLVVVIVYTIFIFAEASVFPRKLAALRLSPAANEETMETLRHIQFMLERYFGVKCVVGLAQAIPTFLLLWAIGIDAPGFWAGLIFFFSFVPTIGSLVGILFPSLLALLQFASLEPFFITLALLAFVQLTGSNWLEPKLTGDSLDLSPLVVLLGVFSGAALWGVIGALIAVPMLSIAMIIFAHVEALRPVAIMMSAGQDIAVRDGAEERRAPDGA